MGLQRNCATNKCIPNKLMFLLPPHCLIYCHNKMFVYSFSSLEFVESKSHRATHELMVLVSHLGQVLPPFLAPPRTCHMHQGWNKHPHANIITTRPTKNVSQARQKLLEKGKGGKIEMHDIWNMHSLEPLSNSPR